MNISQASLFVFVKKPAPGAVKTRLGEAIGFENSARLYQGLAEVCLKRFQRVRNANCTVYFDPPEEARFFQQWFGDGVEYLPQCVGGLGKRLQHGFAKILNNSDAAIALGSDSPDLPLEYLEQAADALSTHDVVIGPTDDGGYYCTGLKKQVPELFDGIHWSTGQVLEQTLQRCESLDLSVYTAPQWSDIDYKDDLIRLCNSDDADIKRFVQQHAQILKDIHVI
ncbi:MAG: TIGR04282 family arsenosugar biosynthesis glycosyltransferase [Candidatus Hinthialibacter antarcticus]|nr:TIGR04282 family arsenosugar biosynthesis glycosyltransferase [Candidatus Hinthialibacter antarcticus]